MHAAGMDGLTYRIGFADAIVSMEDESIRRDFPGFKRLHSLHGCGVWQGQLRPITQTYDVRVEMAAGCADTDFLYPWRAGSVRVLGGAVRPAADGSPVPHLYGPWDDPRGADLCLYYPPDESMVQGRQVAQKLLPWAYEWLYYYEIWLVTGTWAGPEAPHKIGDMPASTPLTERGGGAGRALVEIDDPMMRGMSYLIYHRHPVAIPRSAISSE